jgi:hypothetical protein
MTSKMYSFQKTTQFFQRNNVLDAAASQMDGFVLLDACSFKSDE